jgi:transposase
MSAPVLKRAPGPGQGCCFRPHPRESNSRVGARIMRYELTDYEWTAIKPTLPNKPRGIPGVNDRRVLNGIFLRSGAPWRDVPDAFGPYTTCYNRFVRRRRAGVWGRITDALAAAHDPAVQMIDTSIVRMHQHGACIVWRRATTDWQLTTLLLFNSRQSGYGCALMSPRPSQTPRSLRARSRTGRDREGSTAGRC